MRLINRCPHVNLQGIYGDDIHCVGGYRLYCADCGRYLDGPVSLAQALAEETYEYGVTYIGVNHGGHHIEWVESTGDAEFDKDSLELLVKRWKRRGQSPKVVRRRVSPVEVVNDNRFTR